MKRYERDLRAASRRVEAKVEALVRDERARIAGDVFRNRAWINTRVTFHRRGIAQVNAWRVRRQQRGA